jgi:hypothetical protein
MPMCLLSYLRSQNNFQTLLSPGQKPFVVSSNTALAALIQAATANGAFELITGQN